MTDFTLSEKQRQALYRFGTDERWLFLSGTVRSGKSYSLDLGWILWTQDEKTWPEPTDFIIAGESVSAIRRNVLPQLEIFANWFGIGWRFFANGPYVQCGPHKYWIFGATKSDSADSIKGMTSGGAYLDELTLMDEDFIAMVITRCSLPGAKLVGSTNPDIPMHFIKTDYIDRACSDRERATQEDLLYGRHMEFGLDDNPVQDPDFVADMRRTLVGANYDRMFLGKWVANAGLVYPITLHPVSYTHLTLPTTPYV